ncbi:MAG: sensor histidine kinase [Crocinitomicaceae bacterium]|nr:sensor histidine kinase [Crocinitomicaceae bacterium]
MPYKSLETQIQYKLIEHLSSTNKNLLEEIEKGKLREKKIEAILNEKEILLKEVNHRVKNNLSIILGLLSVQIKLSKSDELNYLLQEVQGRIHSISILHNIMHDPKGKGQISLNSFLTKIIQFNLDNDSNCTINCPELNGYFDKFSSLGMVIHELVMNSLKYAHNPNEALHVYLSIIDNNNTLKVHYTDNGSAITSSDKLSPGFGMNLIEILLGSKEQSNLQYDVSEGRIIVEFEYCIDYIGYNRVDGSAR